MEGLVTEVIRPAKRPIGVGQRIDIGYRWAGELMMGNSRQDDRSEMQEGMGLKAGGRYLIFLIQGPMMHPYRQILPMTLDSALPSCSREDGTLDSAQRPGSRGSVEYPIDVLAGHRLAEIRDRIAAASVSR